MRYLLGAATAASLLLSGCIGNPTEDSGSWKPEYAACVKFHVEVAVADPLTKIRLALTNECKEDVLLPADGCHYLVPPMNAFIKTNESLLAERWLLSPEGPALERMRATCNGGGAESTKALPRLATAEVSYLWDGTFAETERSPAYRPSPGTYILDAKARSVEDQVFDATWREVRPLIVD